MFSISAIRFAADTVFGTAVTLFQRGGVVMWPLLACSLVAVAQAVERVLHYAHERAADALADKRVDRVIAALAAGRFDEAGDLAANTSSAAGRILAAGLGQRDIALQDALNAAAEREIAALRHGLSILDTLITLAPLLGILGTVTGIIRSFHMLSASGAQDPAAVTGGIAEALLTTAAGLIVAILALLPFNFFVSRLKRQARDIEQIIHQSEVAYHQGEGRTDRPAPAEADSREP